MTYRAAPTLLRKSLSESIMNRQPRIRLSSLNANSMKQEVKVLQDNLVNKPEFTLDQPVFVRYFWRAKWVPERIMGSVNSRNYDVGYTLWNYVQGSYPRTTQYSEQVRELQVPNEASGHFYISKEWHANCNFTPQRQQRKQRLANPFLWLILRRLILNLISPQSLKLNTCSRKILHLQQGYPGNENGDTL